MPLLQWKPSFSLGIPAVDLEHRKLIDMINDIYARIDDAHDDPSVQAALADIHAEISAHFALEERVMREAAYHEYAAHKDEHEDLLDQIAEGRDPADGGEA